MTQYFLLKSDGDSDNARLGLTSDSLYGGGVLGSGTYRAAEVSHNNYLKIANNSDYVAIDSFLNSSTITGMTVMSWVRSTDDNGEAYISSHDRSEYYRFNLFNGNLDCSFNTSGGGGDHNSGVFVADGRWHHLAAVYDAGEVRMYVDGRRIYTDTGNASEIGSGGVRYGFLGAGSEAASFDGGTNANQGIVDISDHRLYLDAKTDAEIKSAFEGNPPTANLHEYLPLTSDNNGELNDASGNNRNGFLRNNASIVNTSTKHSISTFSAINTTTALPIGATETSTVEDQPSSAFSSTNVLKPKNWFGIVGQFSSNANILGGADGFDEVAEFDATTNSSYEDIFTNRFKWNDWPSYVGPNEDVYIAFAAKWNEIPFWGAGGVDREWIRQPAPDPNNYQLYILRSTGEGSSFENDLFRLYYSNSNNTAQGRVADPYVWLDWGDQQWDAQIVGDTSSRTVEPTTQLQSPTIEYQLGNGVGKSGPTVFDSFDDGNYSDWTVNEGTLTASSDPAIGDNSMYHDNFGGDDGAREAVKSLNSPRQVESFSFMFWETSNNTSAALSFYNSNGNREFSVGTDNPVWAYDDASGNDSFGNPPTAYKEWRRFTITFDWETDEYTVVAEDLASDYTASHTGTLYEGVDIAEVASGQVGLAGYTGAAKWYLDEMYINVTETATQNTAATSTFNSSATSTTLSNALQDAFTASTFADSSSDTAAAGIEEQFTHANQPADLNTSSVVDAFTERFDTVERTGFGDALTGVTSDTTLATTNGTQSFENALAEPLVASEAATFVKQDGDSFGKSYATVLQASASGLPTAASGNIAVTSLGQTEVAIADPQFDQALVELFAFISPATTTVTPTVSDPNTDTSAGALTENAVAVPITPTLDIIVAVNKGETGLGGTLADSLSASVGAQTSIKVAKTVADAATDSGTVNTFAVPDGVAETATAISQLGSVTTDTSVEALLVAATLQSVGSSSTFSLVGGGRADVTSDVVDGSSVSSSVPSGEVVDTVTDIVDAAGAAEATPEVLAEAAETLVANGAVATETAAASVVSQVVASDQRSDNTAFTTVDSSRELFAISDETSQPTTFSLSEAVKTVVDSDVVDTDAVSVAMPSVLATLVSAMDIDGAAQAEAFAVGDVPVTKLTPEQALLRLLFASTIGTNSVTVPTAQITKVTNSENSIRVLTNE
ncbi:hypothetical protein HAPG_00002 [Halorubrum phage GNf2]|nr:hypothetical protein HAPG_00002 [Halorubrum phage GNf2]